MTRVWFGLFLAVALAVSCGAASAREASGRTAPVLRPVNLPGGTLVQTQRLELADAALRPFFDLVDQRDDPAPPPPALTGFDRAVLAVCGGWGAKVPVGRFRHMLDDPALAADVGRMHQALDGRVLGQHQDLPGFKDQLAGVWFRAGGFRHTLCGEPGEQRLGGLHFAGRYLDMQEHGWGGRFDLCDRSEIAPPIYTIGVRYRTPSGGMATACPKGYAHNLDALEIIVEATRALKHLQARPSGRASCLHAVREAPHRDYLAVFVARDGAIRTFYPHASPRCDDGRAAAACLCAAR